MLRFRDGRFRILMVSDFHAGKSYDPKLRRGLEALLEKTVPDFVMVGGDQCLDRETPAAAGEYMADIMSPVIERKIPWAAVLGNHDREVGISAEEEYADDCADRLVNEAIYTAAAISAFPFIRRATETVSPHS